MKGGWEIKVVDDGDGEGREGRIWVRKRGWGEWWRGVRGKNREEDEVVVTERTRLLE